ncbi:High affinity nitrate transporter 2.5 [Porphyridium purpureum]|uniref:High affinity nitrate transporter 2.5 n=1 Tax=Porphyridium purpureum TaxID=35688 RepID=A0A5J4Z7M5_PORPP|nr:High affinity nitrate transporter 2.5 [Porphyridium purpureum]|eukprot:POR6298..scf295_1
MGMVGTDNGAGVVIQTGLDRRSTKEEHSEHHSFSSTTQRSQSSPGVQEECECDDKHSNASHVAVEDEPGACLCSRHHDNPDAVEQTYGPQPVDPETGEQLFRLPVDEKHRALKLQPWRFDKPHMRSFFFAWFGFFTAFFGWFAVSPLMTTIRQSKELGLWDTETNMPNTKAIGNSNVIAVSGTVLMRLIIGPSCDRFGPRIPFVSILTVFSLPVYLIGTAFNYASFCTARFFIGFLGASFVIAQFWTTQTFAPVIVGVANGTVAGWGNLGGGVTNALMPQFFNLMKAFGLDDNSAWRVVMVIPGTMCVTVGLCLYLFSQDLPDGQYKDMHASGKLQRTDALKSMKLASLNLRSWILFALYAGCFGVELTMNANLSSYFQDVFGMEQSTAGLIAALFGLMNLFARSLGGVSSDFMSTRFGMRGRLIVFFFSELAAGLFLIGFSRARVLGAAVPLLVLFSTCVQMAEGATFGVVPYVDRTCTGAIAGIVGAGGNVGAMTFGLLFSYGPREMPDAFLILGCIVSGIAFLVAPLAYGPLRIGDAPLPSPVSSIHFESSVEESQPS